MFEPVSREAVRCSSQLVGTTLAVTVLSLSSQRCLVNFQIVSDIYKEYTNY